MEQRWAQEIAGEELPLDLLQELGEEQVTIFGITGSLQDLAKMCPVDLADPRVTPEARNVFVVKAMNEAGAVIAERYEKIFTSTLEGLGIERKIIVKPSEPEPSEEIRLVKEPEANKRGAQAESVAAKAAVATSVERPEFASAPLPNPRPAEGSKSVLEAASVVPGRAKRTAPAEELSQVDRAERLLAEIDATVPENVPVQQIGEPKVADAPLTETVEGRPRVPEPVIALPVMLEVAADAPASHAVQELLAEPAIMQSVETDALIGEGEADLPDVGVSETIERPMPPFLERVQALVVDVVEPERQAHVQVLIAKVYELVEARLEQERLTIESESDTLGVSQATTVLESAAPPEAPVELEAELVRVVTSLLQELGEPEPTPEQVERFISLVRGELLADATKAPATQSIYDFLHERLLEPSASGAAFTLAELFSQLVGRVALSWSVTTKPSAASLDFIKI